MTYLDSYYWFMRKIWKICVKIFVQYFKKFHDKKYIWNRYLQQNQKTEHINWAWFGIPHPAQMKLFPKCNFFSQESTNSYRKITLFYQKVRVLNFLCHLIWLRWFNFLVHECLNLTRFYFSVSYALCIQ